jgi:uncharacterized protein YbjQ (UPF0145 family)
MTKENKYRIGFFVLLAISSLLFFDVIRIDMENESTLYPVFISGEPASMPTIKERLGQVEVANCSGTQEGVQVVRTHSIGLLKGQADKLGGNGVIDVVTNYGQHKSLNEKCQFGVSVMGTAVIFSE